MDDPKYFGEFEERLLVAIARVPEHAYGATARKALEDATERYLDRYGLLHPAVGYVAHRQRKDIMNCKRSPRMLTVIVGGLLALTACGSEVPSAPNVATGATTTVQITAVPATELAIGDPTAELATTAPTMTASKDTSGAATTESTDTLTATDTTTATGTITTTLDNGMVLYQQPTDGFAIALPASWQQFDADPAQLQAMLSSVTDKNPSFSALLTSQAQTMTASGIKFMGVDLNPDALKIGYLPNVNVIKQELPVVATPEMLLQATVQQLNGVASITQPIKQEVVTLPAGQAGQLQYHLKLTTGSGTAAEASVLQYLFVKGKTVYVVSMGTPVGDEATYQPIFQQLAQTFAFLP